MPSIFTEAGDGLPRPPASLETASPTTNGPSLPSQANSPLADPPARRSFLQRLGSKLSNDGVAKPAEVSKELEGARRVVYVNDAVRTNTEESLPGNKVRTSKYSLLTFLPRNLFEQFHRIAYIYFLVLVILNQVPALAVFGRTASLFPLLFVVTVTAIKDFYEDYGRHHSDRKVNNTLCNVMVDGEWRPIRWKKVRVGDLVRLEQDEVVPCDLVLLAASDTTGCVYTETMNLDGETTLKSRHAHAESAAQHPEAGPVSGTLVCEPPNRNIYQFIGYLDLGGRHLPLGPQNMLLRGCVVRNTEWVVGVTVYAGSDTKAMLNNSGAQSKRSRLEGQMNRETLWLAAILAALCLVGGIGMGVWLDVRDVDALPYYGAQQDYNGPAIEALLNFFSCVIVFQILIPISLYISMEVVRLGQAYLMRSDQHMYYAPSNQRLKCRALNINEDLGQIRYIFSDKTGTLTQNCMVFQECSVGGVEFKHEGRFGPDGLPSPASTRYTPKAPAVLFREKGAAASMAKVLGPPTRSWTPCDDAVVDEALVTVLKNPGHPLHARAHEFILVLAACNTAVPTHTQPLTEHNQGSFAKPRFQSHRVSFSSDMREEHVELQYQCESPDEQALVTTAAAYGYMLVERTLGSVTIDVHGFIYRYDILGVHEFTSSRKRMSVVVRCPDGTVKLLCKGADSVMLPRVRAEEREAAGGGMVAGAATVEGSTKGHLNRYACAGLRTLVMGSRVLSATETAEWQARYQAASTAMEERGNALEAAAETVETELQLLGATGIEDKLQDGVPETIVLLRAAHIRVWVLTGDKQETAIAIAFACRLLTEAMTQIIINEDTREGCARAIAAARERYVGPADAPAAAPGKRSWWGLQGVKQGGLLGQGVQENGRGVEEGVENGHEGGKGELALVIDGHSLVHALDPELEAEFFQLAVACRVVVCCRVAPLQKAGVVEIMKKRGGEMTLAIGDGANDVSMIQRADVGIGISGQEGRQAVMAADYSIGQFRFLGRLLLVHGHWNYQRLAYMVLYNFYKNAVFIFMLFWFIFYTAWSPQTALSDWNLVLYSLIYTSVPTVVTAILDKDLSDAYLLKEPSLYCIGQRDQTYNRPAFWLTMLDTVWQSLVLFYAAYFQWSGTTWGLWEVGDVWTVAVCLLVHLHLAMDTYIWTWINHVAIWGSIVILVALLLIFDAVPALPQYWVTYRVWERAQSWLVLLLMLVAAVGPRFVVRVVRQRWWPSQLQLARERELTHRPERIQARRGRPPALDLASMT